MAIKRKRNTKYASRKRARYTRGKRYRARRNRRYLRSFLRYTETKYADLNTFHELNHNGGSGLGTAFVQDFNMLQTIQGTNQFTRVGDKVWGKGLKVKMWLSNKLDRSNVIYRIYAITMPVDSLTANPSNLWSGSVTGNNFLLEIINTDKYKVLYQKVINCQTTSKWTGGDVQRETSRYHSFYLKLNRMIGYSADNGQVPKYQRDIIGIGVVAYDASGTLLTDNIASYRLKSRFYFKDP